MARTCFLIALIGALVLFSGAALAQGSRVVDADSTDNRLTQDVIGNKADAAVTTAGSTASQIAYLKGILSKADDILVAVAAGDADSVTTDNLHGKIGTDTEMGDRSLYDILLGDGLGTFPAAAAAANDVSLAEVIRYIQETQLGATATADSVLGSLWGTGGISAFPTAAAAANGVSLAEVLRYVQETLLGASGTADSVLGILSGTGGIATWPTAAVAGNGVSLAEVIGYIQATQLGTSATADTIIGNLYGTAGFSTFPTAAAAANGVSLAEVIRYIQETQLGATGTADSVLGSLWGTGGISAFPTAAAAANGISIAEVLRYVQETQLGAAATADTVLGGLWGTAGLSSFPAAAAAANDVSLAEVIRYIQENLLGGAATADTVLGGLWGTAGLSSFPAAAAAANDVSLAEVIRYIQETQLGAAATADSVLGILSGTGGIGTWASGAAPGDGVSIAEGLRYASENTDALLTPAEATGTTDIDISEFVYTDYVLLLTIVPAAGDDLADLAIDLDYNKTTTGVNDVATAADTLDVCIATKVDGTNFRGIITSTQTTLTGDPGTISLDAMGHRFNIGMVGEDAEVAVYVKLSAERADAEIPYRVTYRAQSAPTITPVAAG